MFWSPVSLIFGSDNYLAYLKAYMLIIVKSHFQKLSYNFLVYSEMIFDELMNKQDEWLVSWSLVTSVFLTLESVYIYNLIYLLVIFLYSSFLISLDTQGGFSALTNDNSYYII